MEPATSPPNASGRYLNYPEPCQGPKVPYNGKKLANPVLKGRILVIAAFFMEWLRFIREAAWKNAGFGSIRKIRAHIEDFEPRYEPTVIPLPEPAAQSDQPNPNGTASARADRLHQAKFYSVSDYHAMYLSGEITPTDVALALLPLIRCEEDVAGKHSTAWMDTKVDMVLKAAEASTLRYKNNQPIGILDGVPTGIKDDYDFDGYATSIGSVNDYATGVPGHDSITNWSVRKLEESGAVILGKLTMHEFGLDTTGNNPHHGTPLNPFNQKYYPGGSSSGPGVAVGSGLIPVALGSDGGGSIRIPSSFCSVFGLKPSHSRVSCYPGANHAPTCAVQGPLAADMLSLKAIYKVLSEPHSSTQFPPLSLQPKPVISKVLGIHQKWFARAEPGVQTLVRSLVQRLCTDHDYKVIDIDIPFLEEGQVAHALTVLTDAATLVPETGNLTAANKILLSLGRTTPATDYLLAQKLRGLLMRHLAYLWKTYPGMLIITPTTACAGWPILGGQSELKYGLNDGNRTMESMAYVWLANFCGLPAITVPAGYVIPEGTKNAGEVADQYTIGKVPVGLMATGEWCSEEALLEFGVDAEAAGESIRCRPPIWEDVISLAKREANLKRIDAGETP
ncbi:amidase signature domain-containing protein [Mariannaea sp. PMI_226]|nr:amidase signature domain-containing protein [Mariannaea sp. PMI_226]